MPPRAGAGGGPRTVRPASRVRPSVTFLGQDIGLDPHGHKSGAVGYYHVGYHVGDIKGTLQALLEAGVEVDQDLKDVGGGRLIASVKDAVGNLIGLLQDV